MSAIRQLPAQASLDHLKNEAKALHRAFCRGESAAIDRIRTAIGDRPELKLLDAQRVLAHEYGFRKWSELRTAVQQLRQRGSGADDSSSRPLTTRTRIALAIGRGIAAAYGHDDVGACHVALGVLREGENPAVAALHRAGVPLREFRNALERALPEHRKPRQANAPLEASEKEVALINSAGQEATERGVPYIGTEHLLLAILRAEEPPIGPLLSSHGVSYAVFGQNLDAVLSGAPST
jgi:hypothetical protein